MTQQATTHPATYRRFTASQRLEHVIITVTFVGLTLTGLPQKYADQSWAQTLIAVMGGVESVRVIHRVLATILMAESIYHGGVITYKLFVLGRQATMMPGIRDLRDLRDWILFNLGLKREHPHLPRYNFGEKAEYLAVVWGTLIMVITGFMMWNPIATARFFPGEVIPAARVAHSNEALLAVLAIITWHMYNVHFKRFNRSMFTGRLSREAMLEEHAEELEAMDSGATEPEVPAEILTRRKRRFWPYAIVVTVVLVTGLIFFITLETSAITTIPRQEVVVFAPNVVPEEGDPAVGAALWPTLRCAMCHGEDGSGLADSPSIRGTNVTMEEFFVQVREGGGEMPAFGRGEIPDAYMVHLWAWLTSDSDDSES